MSKWIPTDPHMEHFKHSLPEHRWLAFQKLPDSADSGTPVFPERHWPVTEVEVEVAVC